ncbi:hypothetical protein PBY51_009253 [Eleginops maclovinus]|uniref:Uncharacterized protein n=1 Tax=Eleginops maclovinus TaxID=56733 RepID=A0AAN7XX32_ELEMC|nr:hypothetical protein PBY51_009253 [Eleginops maclovinus]
MGVVSRLFGTSGRSQRLSSDGPQTPSSKLVLCHRINQLVTCLDDLDPESELWRSGGASVQCLPRLWQADAGELFQVVN